MTKYDRHTLMQMASQGAPFMWVNRCIRCGTLSSGALETLPEGEHLIVIAMRNFGLCAHCNHYHTEDHDKI